MVPFLVMVLGMSAVRTAAEVLAPPYFNIAANKRVDASYTCGEDIDEPELYCKLVGAVQDSHDKDKSVIAGQVCDYCDSSQPEKSHPPNYAVDGTENYWISPPLSRGTDFNKINFTIYLGQEFHVTYVLIKMGISPRPGLWVLERSADNGQTYKPWQYFAESTSDCEHHFGIESLNPIMTDDSVICTTQFSKLIPIEHGEIIVSLLNDRPSANDFFNSPVLQEWTRATNVRLRLLSTQTLYGHLMSVERLDPTVSRRYFYSIKDISIGGRCRCNGHADVCAETKEDKYKLRCVCQHDTCGTNCDKCCPNKVQKPWRQSKPNKLFVCEGCNCHGHSEQCQYNETVDRLHLSLDIHGNYEGGGVCQNCADNTEGINCERCKLGYYQPFGVDIRDPNACVPCNCTGKKYTGNCQFGDGRCECKSNYVSPLCDSCAFGYTNYDECERCRCNVNGTVNGLCDPEHSECPCKPNFDGPQCDSCRKGSYDFPNCKPCECNKIGSLNDICDYETGNCVCKNNYAPPKCDECTNGYYSFPHCDLCNCNLYGTIDEVCDKYSGKCICKEGYAGEHCGECALGYKGFPNCEPCGCSKIGSLTHCDSKGKCPCLDRFSGQTCDQCSPGYYNFPHCLPCGCDPSGTVGKSCDDEGNCKCLDSFQGKHCDKCKEGLFNYPACEACDCHPAGVTANFTGCGQIKGELCECKPRVEGRTCDRCKPLYWNLQEYSPHGCLDCDCHLPGVQGGIAECDSVNGGQCYCKKLVVSRKCDQCADGSYNLEENNVFGCTDCGCDVGGALPIACNKITGQCICKNRIGGQTCNKPLELHYFPTLHQLKYEVEDWTTAENNHVPYNFNETIFPNFSWKGYVVFSSHKPVIKNLIHVEQIGIYKIIVRYVNKNSEPVTGEIIMKETSTDNVHMHKVVFKPSPKPGFVTAVPQGQLDLYLSETNTVLETFIKIPQEAPSIFLDYVVLLPEQYYEGTILDEHIQTPCKYGEKSHCQLYEYPSLDDFASEKFVGLNEFLENRSIPLLSGSQPQMSVTFDFKEGSKGPKVLVVSYASPKGVDQSSKINVNVQSSNMEEHRFVNLAPCHYAWLCRQVILDKEGRVATFSTEGDATPMTVTFLNELQPETALYEVVAIPVKDWTFDYIMPTVVCTMQDSKCAKIDYPLLTGTKKIEFEKDSDMNKTSNYPQVLDQSVVLVRTDEAPEITLNGKVLVPGNHMFIVHYYQPKSPAFTLPVVVQADKAFNASLKFQHCPSRIGCRALILDPMHNSKFPVTNNFKITIQGNQKPLWLDYVLVVPESQYKDILLEETNLNNAERFKLECGADHFHVDTKNVTEFCKRSIFSLTTNYNGGALKCGCNPEGSKHHYCAPFGGQCECRDFVIGRRCEECKAGYYGFPNCKPCKCQEWAHCDKETGHCSCPKNMEGEKCERCKPNTYNYQLPIGCTDCDCHPQGVVNGNLQCDMNSGACSCKENIGGNRCDSCKPGYYSFPYCEECECDLRGTTYEICDAERYGECKCKKNVEGVVCDLCAPGTFNLNQENEDGCTECFCSNRTQECSSSRFYWDYVGDLEDWVLVTVMVKNGIYVTELQTPPDNVPHGISVNLSGEEFREQEVYFSTSDAFLGNKLGSYGGKLKYSLFCTVGDKESFVHGPDIIFSGGGIELFYSAVELPSPSTLFEMELTLTEHSFTLVNKRPASRDHLMRVLENLQAIYLKASYWKNNTTTRIQNLAMDVATEKYTSNGIALSVEQCACPPQYTGMSCEECADGYYRSSTGPYGGFCIPCQCNGHANTCDKVTGVCKDCQHDTTGDHCEQCAEGYHGDATYGTPQDCFICACPLPYPSNNFAKSCDISDDGTMISCNCKKGYYGHRCQSCADGYFGNPEISGDFCKPCECSGNINLNEAGSCDSVSGKCLKCLNNTAGAACNYCKPGYFGDAVTLKNCQSCSCHKHGTFRCDDVTGACECHPNVEGEKCDRCTENHYLFESSQGCIPCNCKEASYSKQCVDSSGQCRCKPGVAGRACEKCDQGYWNYTSEGCTRCSCNLQNSVKVGCNEKGQCECLKDVIGEKCDGCRERWVFVEKEGCFECGKCVHDLLDSVDEMQNRLEPISNEFGSVAKSYFIQRRLQYLNETAALLQPKVNQLQNVMVELNPFKEELDHFQKNVDHISRENSYTLEKVNGTSNDSLSNLSSKLDKNTKTMNKLAKEAIQAAKMTVQNVKNVGESFHHYDVDLDITQAEALDEANDILNSLQEMFSPNNGKHLSKEDVKKSYMERANKALENMKMFKKPVDEKEKALQMLKKRIEDIRKRTKEASKLSTDALKSSKKLSEALKENMKINLPSLFKEISKLNEEAKSTTEKTEALLDEISVFMDNFFISLNIHTDDASDWRAHDTEMKRLTSGILTNDSIENSAIMVESAEKWADNLLNDAKVLESIGKQQLSDANEYNVYNQIISALRSALITAEKAKTDAENAKLLSVQILQNAPESLEMSNKLLADGKEILNKTDDVLLNNVNLTLSEVEKLKNEKDNILKELDAIGNKLEGTVLTTEKGELISDMESANQEATLFINGIGTILQELPKLHDSVKGVIVKKRDVVSKISETGRALEDIKKIMPDVNNLDTILKTKIKETEDTMDTLQKKIEFLNEQLRLAREAANKVTLGAEFLSNTSLELWQSDDIPEQAINNHVSLYFATLSPNSLLFYMGNQAKRIKRRSKQSSEEFMALEVQNGLLKYSVDLGSGPKSVSTSKNVDTGHWHKAIMERTGKIIRLTVITPDKKQMVEEAVLSGTSSILNLDKTRSKIFIGGIPADFSAPSYFEHNNNFFEGRIEDLTIGNSPASLWNFIREENLRPSGGRSELSNVSNTIGCRFDGHGYVAVDSETYRMGSKSEVSMSFKTTAKDGLLFLAVNEDNTFISIELKDGKVWHQFDLGDGVISLSSEKLYNDNQWHRVETSRFYNNATLAMDGHLLEGSSIYRDERRKFTKPRKFYFGGYPGRHMLDHVTNIDFEGCIDNVQLDSVVDLKKNLESVGTIAGCPAKFANVVSFEYGAPGYLLGPVITAGDNSLELLMRFKTSSPNGLLAYATYGPASISLSLRDGQLVFKSGKDELKSDSPKPYNDTKWHVVMANLNREKMELHVDDYQSYMSEEPPNLIRMLHGQIYFGGVPSSVDAQVAYSEKFVGCISDATLNNVIINFANSSEAPQALIGNCVLHEKPLILAPHPPMHKPRPPEPPITFETEKPPQTPEPEPLSTTSAPITREDSESCVLPLYSNIKLTGKNYRFGTKPNSRIEYMSLPGKLRAKYEFTVDIKTTAHYGIIFFASNKHFTDYISLLLMDGMIAYIFNCGSGEAYIHSTFPINDNEWHTITFKRTHESGSLIIDNQDAIEGMSEGSTKTLNVTPPYFIGGLDPAIAQDIPANIVKGVKESFDGCIKNFMVNEQPVPKSRSEVGVIPCSEDYESGAYFPPEGGYIKLSDKYYVGKGVNLRMSIRPRVYSGVLLSVRSKSDYLIVALENGVVVVKIKTSKSKSISVDYKMPNEEPAYICNGKWHNIHIMKSVNSFLIGIDGKYSEVIQTPRRSRDIMTQDPMYLGGTPDMTTPPYVGCIRNITLNNDILFVTKEATFGNAITSVCPVI
ncbi:laminin subunit alpha [Cimex lectularius]|uniref:Laminin subunit alpha n=1 Tax=Cimex lectularius TaxID=79782 RepID=A0A8I6RVR6_CIMLE|nr:laminin subunit alpha [Cimex lectularius]